jgi:hypothetical protein
LADPKEPIVKDKTNGDEDREPQEGEPSAPSPAENESPDDKGREEIEEYGSRRDD